MYASANALVIKPLTCCPHHHKITRKVDPDGIPYRTTLFSTGNAAADREEKLYPEYLNTAKSSMQLSYPSASGNIFTAGGYSCSPMNRHPVLPWEPAQLGLFPRNRVSYSGFENEATEAGDCSTITTTTSEYTDDQDEEEDTDPFLYDNESCRAIIQRGVRFQDGSPPPESIKIEEDAGHSRTSVTMSIIDSSPGTPIGTEFGEKGKPVEGVAHVEEVAVGKAGSRKGVFSRLWRVCLRGVLRYFGKSKAEIRGWKDN
ncbi:hypothetical protein RUND412_008333 [Rhizina undulata]